MLNWLSLLASTLSRESVDVSTLTSVHSHYYVHSVSAQCVMHIHTSQLVPLHGKQLLSMSRALFCRQFDMNDNHDSTFTDGMLMVAIVLELAGVIIFGKRKNNDAR